jgi:hypothetical protein
MGEVADDRECGRVHDLLQCSGRRANRPSVLLSAHNRLAGGLWISNPRLTAASEPIRVEFQLLTHVTRDARPIRFLGPNMGRKLLGIRRVTTTFAALFVALSVLVPSVEAARYPVRNRTRDFYLRASTRTVSPASPVRHSPRVSKGKFVSQSR